MPKGGTFKLNKRTVAWAMKNDRGMISALDDVAGTVAKDAKGHVVEYTTDRAVRAVMVKAEDQAKHGTGSKAAAKHGLKPR